MGDDNQVNDRFKKGEGYHVIPPPYIANYMPLIEKPKTIRSSASLIEKWESDSEDDNVFKPKEVKKTVKPSLEKIEFVNARNTTVENKNNVEKPKKFSQNPRGRPFNQKSTAKTNNFNKKVNTAKVNNVTTVRPKAVVSVVEGNRNNQCNLHSSGFSFLLAVTTFFTSSGNFFWQWELYNWQWECLVHFIPNSLYLLGWDNPVDTPMVDKSKLDEDLYGKPIDHTHYRGTSDMGLWYSKDSCFTLTAYADADHAGYQDTRRSTSRSAQFLGEKLVSWSSTKKIKIWYGYLNEIVVRRADQKLYKFKEEMNIVEEADEENTERVEEQRDDEELKADEEQKEDDQAGDEQVVFINSPNASLIGIILENAKAEINSLLDICIQQNVPHFEQELFHAVKVSAVKELKQADHSNTILVSIRCHIPSVVEDYLGSSLSDALKKKKVTILIKFSRKETVEMIKMKTLQLDQTRENPEGYKSPIDMSKPLPMQDKQGRLAIPVEFFFNNDLEYLKAGNKDRSYSSSIIKTLAARVKDMQVGVKSYQRKLNLTKPQRTCQHILVKEPYTPNYDPLGIIYKDKSKKKRLMHVDEIHEFCDRTLQYVHKILHEMLLNFKFGYNKDMPLREWTTKDKKRTSIMLNKIDDLQFKRRVLRILEVLVGGRKT
nr:hypothetical protein [Tanacetum cinerariifolium]